MDDLCVETLRLNRPWPVIHDDVHHVSSEKILSSANLKKGEAALLIGGPPCQPFSKSGFWSTGDSKRLSDPRASTLDEYLRILEDCLPEAFLLENVAGIAYSGKSEGLEYILQRTEEINQRQNTSYKVEVLRVNAAQYGVPQIRERMLLIAHRDGLSFGDLEPTHRVGNSTERDLLQPDLPPARTAWDAVGHLKPKNRNDLETKGKWADLLPSIPEGQNYLYHTDRGDGLPLFGWRRRFWNFLLKLSKDKPSWTLTAQPGPATGPFHWDNRYLSAEEMMAIQTFPHDYKVIGSRSDAQKQIGNAVPSALGELVGLKMRARFFDEPHQETATPTLVPEVNLKQPPRSASPPVPERFLSLVGEHSAHPGTGKGFGAERIRASRE